MTIKSLYLMASVAVVVSLLCSHPAVASRGARAASGNCAIQALLDLNSDLQNPDRNRGAGFGRIVCEFSDGSEEILPIRIKTKGLGSTSSAKLKTKMIVTGFPLRTGTAQSLLGTFIMGQGGVQVIRLGGRSGLSFSASRRGSVIPVLTQAVQGASTLTIGSGIGYMQIAQDPQNTHSRQLKRLPIRRPVSQTLNLRQDQDSQVESDVESTASLSGDGSETPVASLN